MKETAHKRDGHKPEHGKPKRSRTDRLHDKRDKLEDAFNELLRKIGLGKDTVSIKLVGEDRIVLNAQLRLRTKSERLPGMPNSDEELDVHP